MSSSELIEQPAAEAAVTTVEAVGTDEARCPVPHAVAALAPAGACPFPHEGAVASPPQRSRADQFVRKLLFIKERPAGVSQQSALKAFEKSMLISATRCTLTYVVFPFVLPLLRLSSTVGGAVGIVVGVIAMISDVFTIRRFFSVDHKWRWVFSGVALCVITMLTVLLVQDIIHVLG